MQRNSASDSRLAAWRAEVRHEVNRRLESASDGALGASLDPYAGDADVGVASLVVLIAGRHLADAPRSALGPAAAVEFARLHLRVHATPIRDGTESLEERLLAGDLYRALATRTLLDADAATRRRIGAVDVLSDAIVRGLEDVSAIEVDGSEGRRQFAETVTGAAVRLSSGLFGLTDGQRRSLRAAATRMRPPNGTLPSGRPDPSRDRDGES